MQKTVLCLLLSALFTSSDRIHAQVYDYNYGGKTDHVGISFDLNQNFGSSVTDNDGTRSTFAPFARAGVYLKHQFSPKWYFRAAMQIGNGNFSYRYPQTFLPTSDTTFPRTEMGKRNISFLVLEPEIAIGRLFRFKRKHQLDLRLSVSAPVFLSSYNNYSDTTKGMVTLKTGYRVTYGTMDRFQTNNSGKQWGAVNGNIYIGYKRIHHNDVSDRLGAGLVMGYSLVNEFSGLATYSGFDITHKYQMWTYEHKLNYCYFGIRIEYDLF